MAWDIFAEAAAFLLFGFAVAGVLHVALARWSFARHLRARGPRGVWLATLVGLPLPLCSCSVLPTALTLRRDGASPGATLAFLVSTPETSVPSVLLTYALLGPVMAIVRPIAACVGAIAAGLAGDAVSPAGLQIHAVEAPACDRCDCGVSSGGSPSEPSARPWREQLRRGLRFAYVTLFDDVVGWILVGILAAAAIRIFVPPEVLLRILGGPVQSMLVMVLVGVPLYVCAEASTPIAAVFIAQGVSPGAALVFLLVGPATNLGSIGVLTRALGGRAVAMYLVLVIVVAVGAGLVLDATGTDLAASVVRHTEHGASLPDWLLHGGAIVFLLMSVGSAVRNRWFPRAYAAVRRSIRRLTPSRAA